MDDIKRTKKDLFDIMAKLSPYVLLIMILIPLIGEIPAVQNILILRILIGVICVILGLFIAVFYYGMLYHAILNKEYSGMIKFGWIIFVLFFNIISAYIYYNLYYKKARFWDRKSEDTLR